jgi:uncharacterized membrane protein
MIQCHALSLLWPHLRWSAAYRAWVWVDGLVAPSFLLAAGFALALVLRRQKDFPGRALRSLRRILEILTVATLVNGLWFPLLREPQWLFRLDILHCIGLSLGLVLVPLAMWRGQPRSLVALLGVVSAAFFVAAPLGEAVQGPWSRLTNVQSGSLFPLLPWTGYAFCGAGLGQWSVLRGRGGLMRAALGLAVFGGLIWVLGPWLRGLYPPHQFNVTHPAEHARRLCIIGLVLFGLLALEQHRQFATTRFAQTLALLGRNSLVAYVFHEIVLFYGVLGFSFAYHWGRRSTWPQYAVLTLCLIGLTYMACLIAERLRHGLFIPSPQRLHVDVDRS